ncbi:MAG TPA: DUF2971 domain-containing protein [bacterium]|nr:DUF2971 domain-containing protein [bacterium]
MQKTDFLEMWEIGEKISAADQSLIAGKTIEEIAKNLNISTEDMESHIDFIKIGKFVKEVSEQQKYYRLSTDDQELFLKYLMSKSIYDGIMPITFFRYRPVNRFLFDSLESGTFWFSEFDNLNDPLEGTDVRNYEILSDTDKIEHLRFLERKYGYLPPGTSYSMSFEKYKIMLKSVTKKVRDQIMILSLTGTPDNPDMWSNYSGSGTGICIEIDPFEDVKFFWTIHKVSYVNKLPSIIDSPKTMRLNLSGEYFQALACTKTLEWSYENEWRIVKLFNDEKVNAQPFKKSMIKSIIFGFNTSSEDKEKIKNIVSNANGYRNVIFRRIFNNEMKIVDDLDGEDFVVMAKD